MLIAIGFTIMYLLPPLLGMESSPQVEELSQVENTVSQEPVDRKYEFLRLFGSTFIALILNSSTIFNPSFLKLINGFFTMDLIAMWILP